MEHTDFTSTKLRPAYIVAVSVITLLAAFSIYAYQERMFFVDPCWITFNIINTRTFSFAEHRYGAFITQLFPLVGVYLGLSLKAIIILYSVSFYVFYLSATLLVGMVWKQKWMGILLVLYLTVFVSDGYYWPNNEVHQGIAWMLLFLAYYRYGQSRRKIPVLTPVCLLLLAFLALSSHLIVAIPFSFLWIYLHISQPFNCNTYLKDRRFWGYSLLLTIMAVIRYKVSDNGWYDPVKLASLKGLSIQKIAQAFHSGQSQSFLNLIMTNYWWALPIFLTGLVLLIKAKRYVQVCITVAFTFGYYALICIVYPDAFDRNLQFYMESEWMALCLIIATPLVLQLAETKINKHLITLLFLIIFSIRLGYIFDAYGYFRNRLNHLTHLIEVLAEKQISKALIVSEKSFSDELFIMDWGLPVESLMLSKVKGYTIPVTFKVVQQDFKIIPEQDSFYSCFGKQALTELNTDYFQPDTTKQYTVIQDLELLMEDNPK